MAPHRIIWILCLAVLPLAGCSNRVPLERTALSQSGVDEFLAAGRDARMNGITIYSDAAGARFEFANRPSTQRSAQMDIVAPKRLRTPVIKARTGRFTDIHLLLDTSARQSWLLLPTIQAMEYRPFAPPTGEYPDHVPADIPGYAGVANKVVLNTLHIESPVFYVPPARGGLGPLARATEQVRAHPKSITARSKLATRTHGVLGAAVLRNFAFVRFDFPERQVAFSSDGDYRPQPGAPLLARLPLRDWRGRPAIDATLGGEPILLVLDSAGEFDLSVPAGTPLSQPLLLGDWEPGPLAITTHEDHDLPPGFPARLGLGVLARNSLTIDFKQRRVWIEGKPLRAGRESVTIPSTDPAEPVHYRGVKP